MNVIAGWRSYLEGSMYTSEKLGKKIMVIGSPGSGKSTFSRQVAEITGLPLIHLDKHYWNFGWIETPKNEWLKKHEALISGDEWVTDGNYGGTIDIRLDKADTIILFDLNRRVCLLSYFKRVITNLGKVRIDMPEGCSEKFDFKFMIYIWNFPGSSGQRNKERIKKYNDKNIIIFTKRSESIKFLKELRLTYAKCRTDNYVHD